MKTCGDCPWFSGDALKGIGRENGQCSGFAVDEHGNGGLIIHSKRRPCNLIEVVERCKAEGPVVALERDYLQKIRELEDTLDSLPLSQRTETGLIAVAELQRGFMCVVMTTKGGEMKTCEGCARWPNFFGAYECRLCMVAELQRGFMVAYWWHLKERDAAQKRFEAASELASDRGVENSELREEVERLKRELLEEVQSRYDGEKKAEREAEEYRKAREAMEVYCSQMCAVDRCDEIYSSCPIRQSLQAKP